MTRRGISHARRNHLKKVQEAKREIKRRNILSHGYSTKAKAEAAGFLWLTSREDPVVKQEIPEVLETDCPLTNERAWSCIEIDKIAPKRIISFENIESSRTKPGIGDLVSTAVDGERVEGVLVCSSAMGLTAVDVFNDIMVSETDLRAFLKQNNVESVSGPLPGLIIQAYMTFCDLANAEMWSFETAGKSVSNTEVEPNFDNYNDEGMEDDDEEPEKKIAKKSAPESSNKQEEKEKLEQRKREVLTGATAACEVCNPTTWEQGVLEFYKIETQTILDHNYKKHKSEAHGEKTMYAEEGEYWKGLKQKFTDLPESVEINGEEFVPCPAPDCHTRFTKGDSGQKSLLQHLEYHEDLSTLNLSYSSSFPCLKCPLVFESYIRFDSVMYGTSMTLVEHVDQEHPRFTYHCLVPNCTARYTSFKTRQNHFLRSHNEKLHSTPICEVCGATYKTQHGLGVHMKTHDPANMVTCDICGKTFKTKEHLKLHFKRYHVIKFDCDRCDKSFVSRTLIEAHKVFDHGEERQYSCKYCGAKFVAAIYRGKHEKKYHEETDSPRTPRRQKRSRNKLPK